MVDRTFACCEFNEQGFNAALAVLRLSRHHTPARLERTCEIALATEKRSTRYRDVKPVLGRGRTGRRPARPQVAATTRAALASTGRNEHIRQRGNHQQAQGYGGAELLTARSAQDEPEWAGMAFSERVQMAVDEEHSDFISQKVRNLTRM